MRPLIVRLWLVFVVMLRFPLRIMAIELLSVMDPVETAAVVIFPAKVMRLPETVNACPLVVLLNFISEMAVSAAKSLTLVARAVPENIRALPATGAAPPQLLEEDQLVFEPLPVQLFQAVTATMTVAEV